MRGLLSFLFVTLFFNIACAKVFTKCGLACELNKLCFNRSLLGNWVCLIESESAKNTSKEIIKADGSKALGLFQIRSNEWCTFGRAGGKCNMRCEDLLNEDLSDDSACAKKIYAEKGFRYWEGWMRSCYNRRLPIDVCFGPSQKNCNPSMSGPGRRTDCIF